MSKFQADVGRAPDTARSPSRVRLWRRFSLRQQMVFGFIVPLLIVLLASVSLVRALDGLRASQAAFAESSEATGLRYALLNLVLEAETGLGAYLASGNPEYLQPYQDAWAQPPAIYARLEATEAEEPTHIQKLRRVRSLFLDWRERFAIPAIALRRATPVGVGEGLRRLASLDSGAMAGRRAPPGDERALLLARLAEQRRELPADRRADELAAALAAARVHGVATPLLLALAGSFEADDRRIVALATRGKQRIDQIRSLMRESFADERSEQRRNASNTSRMSSRARWIAILAPAAALAVGLTFILLLVFDAIRAIAAATKAAVAVARGDLAKRMRVLRRDEIGALGTAFNLMADELADHRCRSAALDSFQTLLISSNTTDEIHAAVARMGAVMFPGWAGAIYRIAASHDLVERLAQWNWPDDAGGSLWHPEQCRAIRAARPYYSSGQTVEIPCRHSAEVGVQVTCSLCLPLSAQGEVLGILQLCRFGGPAGTELTAKQRETAAVISEQLSMSLANLQLRETLRNQSIRDPLTGLFNRRFLEETMSRELARATRSGQPLAVAVIDVDHFKLFNDRFGHEAGDLVLVELAAVFKQFVRRTDIVCRFGGEEFVLLMPDSPLPAAIERADALRMRVGELVVRLGPGQLESVSISIGVARWSGPGQSAEALLRQADTALYAAKNGGRDRVEAYQPP